MVYFSRAKFKKQPIIQVLKTIYGINFSKALLICRLNGVTLSTKFNELPLRFIERIERFMSKNMKVDRELKQRHNLYLNELREDRTFKSFRKNLGLPSNGQRSKTNAKTAKKFGKKLRKQQVSTKKFKKVKTKNKK